MLGYGGAFRPTKFTFQIYDCLNRFSQNKNQLDGLGWGAPGVAALAQGNDLSINLGEKRAKTFLSIGEIFPFVGPARVEPDAFNKVLASHSVISASNDSGRIIFAGRFFHSCRGGIGRVARGAQLPPGQLHSSRNDFGSFYPSSRLGKCFESGALAATDGAKMK